MNGMRVLSCAVALALGCGLAMPGAAQSQARSVKVGFLAPIPQPTREAIFRAELASHGFVEGRNLVIEYRQAGGDFARLPALAAELVEARVDVLVSVVTQSSVAAKAATRTTPIVMVAVGDPVGAGLVQSLARPGGNITGTTGAAVEVTGKQLELLREIRPGLRRVAVLWNPANDVFQRQLAVEAQAAAKRLRLEVSMVEAASPDAFDAAFAAIVGERAEAILVLGDPMFAQHARRIADRAIASRLPTVSGFENLAEAGILLTYGASFEAMYRRSALYVARILQGATPATLPIERPTRFDLVVNAATARALGLALPATLIGRADRVIP
jgi:putative ABC transport system substrate-binding protein